MLVAGENGVGKTNLLEALHLGTQGFSPRTRTDGQLIRFGESLSSSPSFSAFQEMTVDTSGGDATLAGGGVRINYIPRDGGNTFKGLMFFSGANQSMQFTNYTTTAEDGAASARFLAQPDVPFGRRFGYGSR